MRRLVHGIYHSEEAASEAVQALVDAHVAPDDISVLLREPGGTEEVPVEHRTRMGAGATIGAALGAVGGAVVAPVAGLLAAGPLAAALQGALAGGAIGSGFGVLGGLGYWRDEPQLPDKVVSSGGVLVGVELEEGHDLEETVLEVLKRTQAEDVRSMPKQSVAPG